jgi:hypothetical protein
MLFAEMDDAVAAAGKFVDFERAFHGVRGS